MTKDEEFDEDGNEIRPATAATDKSRKGPLKPTRETGRVCVILIAGILRGFMKISEEGSSFIPQKVQDVYEYFGDYDFKNCWKTAANQIKDHQSFYKAVIN